MLETAYLGISIGNVKEGNICTQSDPKSKPAIKERPSSFYEGKERALICLLLYHDEEPIELVKGLRLSACLD